MKKFCCYLLVFAVLLTALLGTVSGTADGLITQSDYVGIRKSSWDVIRLDGKDVCTPGTVTTYIDQYHNTVLGPGDKLSFGGWFALDTPFTQFGYVIDDNAPVYDDAFSTETDAAVIAAAGKDCPNVSRFLIEVPVTGLTGKHEIRGVVRLEDGRDMVLSFNTIKEMMFYYTSEEADFETPAPTVDPGSFEYYYLYDKDGKTTTGWWFHPYTEGQTLEVDFASPVWFNGIRLYTFASQNKAPIQIVLESAASASEYYAEEVLFSGNAWSMIDFGMALKPGDYILTFTAVEYDDQDGSVPIHWVMGSAPLDENVEMELINGGAAANGDTQEAPVIMLIQCEEDPDWTEPTAAPTAVPTDTPEPTETPEPTAEATPLSTEEPTQKPGKENKGILSDKKALLIGIIAGAGVLLAVGAVLLVVTGKKKQ